MLKSNVKQHQKKQPADLPLELPLGTFPVSASSVVTVSLLFESLCTIEDN